jgi:hypothetical protein
VAEHTVVDQTVRDAPDPEPGPFSAPSLRHLIKWVAVLLIADVSLLISFVVLVAPLRWSVAALITAIVLAGTFRWMHEEIKSAQYRADARAREQADKDRKPSQEPHWQTKPTVRPVREGEWGTRERREPPRERREPPPELPPDRDE